MVPKADGWPRKGQDVPSRGRPFPARRMFLWSRWGGGLLALGGAWMAAVLATTASVSAASAAEISSLDDPRQSTDAKFLAGLRARRLYELAEYYCRRTLEQKDLPESRRAELSIELSIVLTESALGAAPAERSRLWQEAQKPLADFLQQFSQSPWRVPVQLQEGLNQLAIGELLRQEAELAGAGPEALVESRQHLRAAIRRLEELLPQVEQMRRQWSQDRPAPKEPAEVYPTAAQMDAMAETIRYELSRAYRNQAQTYPMGSADRADTLQQAIKLLDWTARLEADHPLVWTARLDQILCYRLLGRRDEARQRLAQLFQMHPPPEIQARSHAEAIRLLLEEGKFSEAGTVAEQARQQGLRTAELDLAVLEILVSQYERAQKTQDAQQSEQWYQQASAQVRLLGQAYGPYWMRRGEVLLAGRLGRTPEAGSVAALVRAAEGFFRSGKFAEAIEAYDRAQKAALDQGDPRRAFQLGFLAATIEHQQGRHPEALARYRQLAQRWPDDPQAAQAHELAVHHAAQLAQNGDPKMLEQYEALLTEHRRRWPQDPSTDRIRHLAGRWAERKGDWAAAAQAYTEVSPSDADFVQAVESAGRAYARWLAEEKAAGKPVASQAQRAAGWFESIILGPEQRLPERWSPAQRAAALAAARLWLDFTPKGYQRAEPLLAAAIHASPDADDQWKSDARMLWAYCLAAAGRQQQASQLLQEVGPGKPEVLLVLLEGLTRLSAEASPEVRAEVAKLQLRTLELLQSQQARFGEAVQRMLVRIQAQALAEAGHTQEALAAFREAAARYPKDSRIQEAYAEFCVAQSEPALIEEGLRKWREIDRQAPLASPLWFRAQYGIAWAQYRLGRSQQALDRIRQLEILRPDLGGPESAARFRRLKTLCQKGN